MRQGERSASALGKNATDCKDCQWNAEFQGRFLAAQPLHLTQLPNESVRYSTEVPAGALSAYSAAGTVVSREPLFSRDAW
jgi:hypothetical protein